MKKSTLTISILLIGCISYAQAHQEKCVYGNCKNGYGVKYITGNKKSPFSFVNTWSSAADNYYYYYEIGNFKNGQLSGQGFRISTPDQSWVIQMVKNNQAITPDLNKYDWFETGEYLNGMLNGKGFLIEYKQNFAQKLPYRIREGIFKNGLLEGIGTKITADENQLLYTEYDNTAAKYKVTRGRIFQGNFVQDICTSCTMNEIRTEAETGSMSGNIIQENFFSGWFLKNYLIDNGKLKLMAPYRVLYVGGVELKRIDSAQVAVNQKTIALPGDNIYTGEVDEKGNPYGFGIMSMYGKESDVFYEGYVDNGKPEGWGYVGDKRSASATITGGAYTNNILTYGVIFHPSTPVVIKFGSYGSKQNPDYHPGLKDILNGPYTKISYAYDFKTRRYRIEREESGFKVNGYSRDVWAGIGKTIEEKRRQRNVVNGKISISDLTIGDIIVLEDMASPVDSFMAGAYYLRNKKRVSALQTNTVQLSKHALSVFQQTCNECKGTGQISYTYQRADEQVTGYVTRTETVVMDYTIWRKTVSDPITYTKKYPPEKRVRNCEKCNGTTYSIFLKEIKE